MNLRPTLLDEVIGQHDVKKQLKISIEASRITKTIFPHCLISGPFGLGKTTIAEAIANELGRPIEIINGSNLRNLKNLLPSLARIKRGSILFCDEIHKVSPLVQTYLLTVLEKFSYTLGSNQESLTIPLPEFTFIGATTNVGPLSPPLVNRFTYHYKLKPYSLLELSQIIRANATKIQLDIPENCSIIVAATCRGTPRTSVNRLRIG
jgi:holliday junction DNA helicase RuvB